MGWAIFFILIIFSAFMLYGTIKTYRDFDENGSPYYKLFSAYSRFDNYEDVKYLIKRIEQHKNYKDKEFYVHFDGIAHPDKPYGISARKPIAYSKIPILDSYINGYHDAVSEYKKRGKLV
jgi:hypothetical protein